MSGPESDRLGAAHLAQLGRPAELSAAESDPHRRGDRPADEEPRALDNPQPPDLSRRLALRPRELAEALGVSERALRQLAPELPRVCRRGLVLYPVDAIREWLRREARADGEAIRALVADTLSNLSGDS